MFRRIAFPSTHSPTDYYVTLAVTIVVVAIMPRIATIMNVIMHVWIKPIPVVLAPGCVRAHYCVDPDARAAGAAA